MTLQELQEQVCQLSVSDRLVLMNTIVRSLQNQPTSDWQYLVARPHPWRRQLYVKGKKLLASTVQQDMAINQMTPEQAAENWELPIAAIQEVMQKCDRHQALIALE